MAKICSIHGGSANCGKTVISVCICRALHNNGISIAPFKAVSVLEKTTHGWLNTVDHLCGAARLPYSYKHNPIIIKPNELEKSANVYLNGELFSEVDMINRDTPLFSGMNHRQLEILKDEIYKSLKILAKDYEFILCEGASSPLDLLYFEEFDLSNFGILTMTNTVVYLVVRCIDGGQWASLLGTYAYYPSKYRNRLRGFIINDVLENDMFFKQNQLIQELSSLQCYGIIPRLNYFEGVEESQPIDFEKEYEIWGEVGRKYLDVDSLVEASLEIEFIK